MATVRRRKARPKPAPRPAKSPARAARARRLPATETRVPRQTAAEVNRRIAQRTEQSIAWHAAHPEAIDQRLRDLDAEWDIERLLETNASALALAGVTLGLLSNRRWLLLPGLVSGFLLQHALQGWCPPLPAFRRLGVRTAREIAEERAALKALRGDFDKLPRASAKQDPGARAEAVIEAVRS